MEHRPNPTVESADDRVMLRLTQLRAGRWRARTCVCVCVSSFRPARAPPGSRSGPARLPHGSRMGASRALLGSLGASWARRSSAARAPLGRHPTRSRSGRIIAEGCMHARITPCTRSHSVGAVGVAGRQGSGIAAMRLCKDIAQTRQGVSTHLECDSSGVPSLASWLSAQLTLRRDPMCGRMAAAQRPSCVWHEELRACRTGEIAAVAVSRSIHAAVAFVLGERCARTGLWKLQLRQSVPLQHLRPALLDGEVVELLSSARRLRARVVGAAGVPSGLLVQVDGEEQPRSVARSRLRRRYSDGEAVPCLGTPVVSGACLG